MFTDTAGGSGTLGVGKVLVQQVVSLPWPELRRHNMKNLEGGTYDWDIKDLTEVTELTELILSLTDV